MVHQPIHPIPPVFDTKRDTIKLPNGQISQRSLRKSHLSPSIKRDKGVTPIRYQRTIRSTLAHHPCAANISIINNRTIRNRHRTVLPVVTLTSTVAATVTSDQEVFIRNPYDPARTPSHQSTRTLQNQSSRFILSPVLSCDLRHLLRPRLHRDCSRHHKAQASLPHDHSQTWPTCARHRNHLSCLIKSTLSLKRTIGMTRTTVLSAARA